MRVNELIEKLELGRRDEALVRFHFGLVDGTPKTYQQTAQHFGISSQRVSQIVKKVSRRLRHPSKRTLVNEVLTQSKHDQEWELLVRLLSQLPENRFGPPHVNTLKKTVPPKNSESNQVRFMRNEFGLEALRGIYSNAYQKWPEFEDQQLKDEYLSGLPCEQIVRNHARTPLAVLMRLARLGLVVHPPFIREMKKFQRQARKLLREND